MSRTPSMDSRFNVAAFLLLFAPVDGLACSCGAIPDAPAALKNAAAVFQGKVAAIEDSYTLGRKIADWLRGRTMGDSGWEAYLQRYGFRIVFEVGGRWKGPTSERLVVITGRSGITQVGGDCGVPVSVGYSYLVFARTLPDGQLYTTICTPGGELSRSGQAISALGPPGVQ